MNTDSVRWAVKCRGHRRDGSPCGRWAIRGGYVCPKHGGASPQARRKALERLTEIAAYRTLDAWLASPAYQAHQELLGLAGDRAAVEAFAARLG